MEFKYKSRINKYEVKTIDGEEVYVETPEWKRIKKEKKDLISLKKSSVPYHAINLSLNDIVGYEEIKSKLEKYIDNFETKFRHVHLYFWGTKNGTQKTTTASIIAKELFLKGFSIEFVLMSNLTKMLTQESFDNLEETITRYKECDFLVIDDSFDPRKITLYKSGYQVPFLDTFLRERLETKRKATCFTSNINVEDLSEEAFGISLVKLIQRSIIDPFEFNVSFSKRNDFDPKSLWS